MVDMQDFEFAPATIIVTPGARVAFRNLDDQVHTATSATVGFDTGNIGPDQSGTIVAPSAPGEYAFYCVHHAAIGEGGTYEGMVGTLAIEDLGADPAAKPTPEPTPLELIGLATALAIFLPSRWRLAKRRR